MAANIFSDFLAKMGLPFEQIEVDNKIIFVIEHYKIPHGRHSGKTVQIGLPIPKDFPNTAPYGLHIRKSHGFQRNTSAAKSSPLGDDWEFWSRKLGWDDPSYRTPRYYFDQVNRWLEVT